MQVFDCLEDLPPGCRDEACSNAGGVYEDRSAIKAHHQGIETKIAWNVASHNELLAEADSVLGP
jgi:hypothetical protein